MKGKKFLAGILSAAMVLSTMSFTALAEEVNNTENNIQLMNNVGALDGVTMGYLDADNEMVDGDKKAEGFSLTLYNLPTNTTAMDVELWHDSTKLSTTTYQKNEDLAGTVSVRIVVAGDADISSSWSTTLHETDWYGKIPNIVKVKVGNEIKEIEIQDRNFAGEDKYQKMEVAKEKIAEVNGKTYSSLQKAYDNATNNATITLNKDIVLSKADIEADDNFLVYGLRTDLDAITFDLGGRTISLAEDAKNVVIPHAQYQIFHIKNTDCTIKNGHIDLSDSTPSETIFYGVICKQSKYLRLDVDITVGKYNAQMVQTDGKSEINGGTYTYNDDSYANYPYVSSAWYKWLMYLNSNNACTINGGTFVNFDPLCQSRQAFYTNSGLGEGKVMVKDGGTFTVTDEKDAVATITRNVTCYDEDDNGRVYERIEERTYAYTSIEAAESDKNDGETINLLNAEGVTVSYEDVTENEGEKVYDLYVEADNSTINRLTSAEFTFALDTQDAIDYVVSGAQKVNVTPDNSVAGRYLFNFNGIDAADITGKKINIGQIKFTGYGTFSFAITDGEAHATTFADNIVTDFVANPDANNKKQGKLDYSVELTNVEIKKPTRKLTINVTFPNAVNDNAADYQKMNVTIKGGEYEETFALGTDTKAMTEGAYVVTEDLVKDTTYTVEVSGAGYRTARYNVRMNDNKTLNFWNNVKDNAIEVETGNEAIKKNVTFLAGELVNDGKINIYDLSAVVSYFGATNLVDEYPEYAKYDLNRDGKIDSKDIAYVLVSWGK